MSDEQRAKSQSEVLVVGAPHSSLITASEILRQRPEGQVAAGSQFYVGI